jgi:hypothetical protein
MPEQTFLMDRIRLQDRFSNLWNTHPGAFLVSLTAIVILAVTLLVVCIVLYYRTFPPRAKTCPPSTITVNIPQEVPQNVTISQEPYPSCKPIIRYIPSSADQSK